MLTITRSQAQNAAEHGLLSKPLIQEAHNNYYPIVTIDGNSVAIRTKRKNGKKESLIYFTQFMSVFNFLISLGFNKEDINIKSRPFIPGSANSENHVKNGSVPAMRRNEAIKLAQNDAITKPIIVSYNEIFYVDFYRKKDNKRFRLRSNTVNEYLKYANYKRAKIMITKNLGFNVSEIIEE